MRTAEDAVLSLQRYLAIALGPDWEARLWSEEGSFSPPIARIAEAGPLVRARHGRGSIDLTLPLQVHCYTTPALTAAGSLLRARAVEEQLHEVIEVGVGDARPRRIPLYDATTEQRAYYDFLRVVDLSVTRMQDSDDATLVVVVADLRLAWSRTTLTDPATVDVAGLRTRIA